MHFVAKVLSSVLFFAAIMVVLACKESRLPKFFMAPHELQSFCIQNESDSDDDDDGDNDIDIAPAA